MFQWYNLTFAGLVLLLAAWPHKNAAEAGHVPWDLGMHTAPAFLAQIVIAALNQFVSFFVPLKHGGSDPRLPEFCLHLSFGLWSHQPIFSHCQDPRASRA